MSKSKQKFCVYLAGPISGCNNTQIHRWRDQVRKKYADKMDFIDPTERRRVTSYQIVEADIAAIEEADGLLVNMWCESIGSAIGMVHAHREGKPVAVADPNHLNNQTLNFYATAVADTTYKAADALLRILRANAGWKVGKSGAREEPFKREKLVGALRKASRSARRNNIVVPVLVLPRVIARLDERDRKIHKRISTADINRAVIGSLRELEQTAEYAGAVKGIAAKWQERADKKRAKKGRVSMPVKHNQTAHVVFYSSNSHRTIWGRAVKELKDIPSGEARRVFEIIKQVRGIASIRFGRFTSGPKRKQVRAAVYASKQKHIIEGKIFDNGEKGSMQMFQVRFQIAEDAPRIFNEIADNLKAAGYWTG